MLTFLAFMSLVYNVEEISLVSNLSTMRVPDECLLIIHNTCCIKVEQKDSDMI
jgi:hypothetical protein